MKTRKKSRIWQIVARTEEGDELLEDDLVEAKEGAQAIEWLVDEYRAAYRGMGIEIWKQRKQS